MTQPGGCVDVAAVYSRTARVTTLEGSCPPCQHRNRCQSMSFLPSFLRCVRSFVRSLRPLPLVGWLVGWFVRSMDESVDRSMVHSLPFVRSFVRSFVLSLVRPSVRLFDRSFARSFARSCGRCFCCCCCCCYMMMIQVGTSRWAPCTAWWTLRRAAPFAWTAFRARPTSPPPGRTALCRFTLTRFPAPPSTTSERTFVLLRTRRASEMLFFFFFFFLFSVVVLALFLFFIRFFHAFVLSRFRAFTLSRFHTCWVTWLRGHSSLREQPCLPVTSRGWLVGWVGEREENQFHP